MRPGFKVTGYLIMFVLLCFPAYAQENDPHDQAGMQGPHPQPEGEPQYNIFVKFENIPGESNDTLHKDWCDALACEHGVSAEGDMQEDRRRQGAAPRPFVILKHMDKATPALNDAALQRKVIPRVTVHLVNRSENALPFMEYELRNVRLISVSVSARAMEGQFMPVEEIGMLYEEIKWKYTQFDMTGKAKAKFEASWKVEPGEQ
jgi:type VI secretion system secreted protein Hcp